MSLEGQTEMVTKANREDVYSYPAAGQGQNNFSESSISNYSYSTAATTDYGFNGQEVNTTRSGGSTFVNQGPLQEMSGKTGGEAGSWHLQNANAHSLTMSGSTGGYGNMNMNSQYYHQSQNSPSQHQQQASTGQTSVKYEERYTQQQPTTASTYTSGTSQEFTTVATPGGGLTTGGQAQYQGPSFLDQGIVKTEDGGFRYNCSSTTNSVAGGSPNSRSVSGSNSNSQDSDYSGQPSQTNNLFMMGITSSPTSSSSTSHQQASVKTEAGDSSYFMPGQVSCTTSYMSGMLGGGQGGLYSGHLDHTGGTSSHQYKMKTEGGYYGSHVTAPNSSPDYPTSHVYSPMDRFYKRASPYDRLPQQPYRQRDTPPAGITPPHGGHNYTLEDLQQQSLSQPNHQHQMAAMMYMRHGGHHQAELAMHQTLPQIESLYNRGPNDSPRMVSPMSHLMYQHDSPQGHRQLTPPMGHHGRAGNLYSQDPDMQQIQTMVQSYTGRPGDHQRPLVDMEGEPPRTTPPVVWTDTKMDFPLPEVKDISGTFLMLEKQLCEALRVLEFRSPVEYIYNPMEYAWEPHSNYVQRYCNSHKPVLFLGMNPGPFGMAQTGVPFGEVTLVKEWLGISGQVNKPVREHPKKLILGFDCPRSEISGSRFWGFFKKYCGKPDNFFRYCFVHNICPLIFMNHNAKNITPPQLPVVERKPLNRLCSQHLCDVVRLLNTKIVIGIGKFAQDQAKMALEEAGITGVKVTWIMHPSPANPIANRGWEEVAKRQLEEMDVLKYIVDQPV